MDNFYEQKIREVDLENFPEKQENEKGQEQMSVITNPNNQVELVDRKVSLERMPSLDDFLIEPIKPGNKEDKDEIMKLIDSRNGPEGKFAFKSEKSSLNLLCQKAAQYTYSRLDLSFLGVSDILDYECKHMKRHYKVIVPKFGVYPLGGESKFSIHFNTYNDVNIQINNDELPKIFDKELLKSLVEIVYESEYPPRDGQYYKIRNYLNRDTYKNYKTIYDLIFYNEFYTFLPSKNRENIHKSKTIFKTKELYVITKTKPNEPNPKFAENLLIVGVINDECFLVDSIHADNIKRLCKDAR